MKEIMTPREAAEYLSVHVRTIYRLVKNGGIPGRKLGGVGDLKRKLWMNGFQGKKTHSLRKKNNGRKTDFGRR